LPATWALDIWTGITGPRLSVASGWITTDRRMMMEQLGLNELVARYSQHSPDRLASDAKSLQILVPIPS
jgi:hypothetical protein